MNFDRASYIINACVTNFLTDRYSTATKKAAFWLLLSCGADETVFVGFSGKYTKMANLT